MFASEGMPASLTDVVHEALTDPAMPGRHQWGDYIYLLIVYDKLNDRFLVLADPCGQRTAFHYPAADGAVHIQQRDRRFACAGQHAARAGYIQPEPIRDLRLR